jgi:hypothetical protein
LPNPQRPGQKNRSAHRFGPEVAVGPGIEDAQFVTRERLAALGRRARIDHVDAGGDVEVAIARAQEGVGRLQTAHKGRTGQINGLERGPGMALSVGQAGAADQTFGSESRGLSDLDQPLLVPFKRTQCGHRGGFADGRETFKLNASQPRPPADRLRSGVVDLAEGFRRLAADGEINIDGASLGACGGTHRSSDAHPGNIRRQQKVALSPRHIEGLHAAQFLGVTLDQVLHRTDVAPDAHIDHVGFDHLQHQRATGDALLWDFDAGKDATFEYDACGPIADRADHGDFLRRAQIFSIGCLKFTL